MIASGCGETAWAIVPVKRFDRAKSRLANILSAAERAALAEAMLRDVLREIARAPGLAGVVVVTGDEEARVIAAEFMFEAAADPDEAGLNAAVRIGLAHVGARGGATAVVIPGDIPWLAAEEIQAVLSALASAAVVLAPAARDGGTNVLALRFPWAIAPAFGQDSAARHFAAARAAGAAPAILDLSGARRDIDVAADLVFDPALPGAPRTRAWLRRRQAAERASDARSERATG